MEEKRFIALDLEMNQPSGKIIQVGWCVGTIDKIEYSNSCYINPNEQLNPRIIQLTGITQNMVDNLGCKLEECYMELCKEYKENPWFINPLTWGGGDTATLRDQLGMNSDRWIFGRRWIDVKTIYQAYRLNQGLSIQSGLAKSLHRLGGQFQGRKHDAENDARNTLKAFQLLMEKLK